MISGYFVWWYSTGINQAYDASLAFISYITDAFSLPTLVRTLFQPWKNDVLQARNASLADQIKIWQLNLASRIVGFFVRLVVIVATLIILTAVLVLVGLLLVAWVLTPLAVIVLPILGAGRLFT